MLDLINKIGVSEFEWTKRQPGDKLWETYEYYVDNFKHHPERSLRFIRWYRSAEIITKAYTHWFPAIESISEGYDGVVVVLPDYSLRGYCITKGEEFKPFISVYRLTTDMIQEKGFLKDKTDILTAGMPIKVFDELRRDLLGEDIKELKIDRQED